MPVISTAALCHNITFSGAGATLEITGGNSLTVYGNWSDNGGTFLADNTSTVTIGGTGTQTISSTGGSETFYNLTIGNTLSASGSINLNIKGNWTNNSTFTAGSSTVTFNGTTQSIGGSAATAFNTITIANGSVTTGPATNGPTANTFNINNGGKYIKTDAGGIMGGTRNFGATSTYEIQNSGMTFANVSFGNLIINFSGAGNLSAGGLLQTVQGNLTIQSTGTGTFSLATTQTPTVNIAGNLIVNAGTFNFSTGSGAPTVNITGDVQLNGGTLQPTGSGGSAINSFNVFGNWTNNGGTFVPDAGTVNFNNSSADQTINGTSISETFNNLTLNKNGNKLIIDGNIITVNVGGVLTFPDASSGIISTATTHILVITNTATTAISGGGTNAYIDGPVIWHLPANLSSGSTYDFPVGNAGSYLPFSLNNPTTGAGGATAKVQAVVDNSGGTSNVDGTLVDKSDAEYWSLSTTGDFLTSSVSIANPGGTYNAIGGSTAIDGTPPFTSLGGSASGTMIMNSDPIGGNTFFVRADVPASLSVSGLTSDGTTAATSVSTTYGTPSSTLQFDVTAMGIVGGVLITAPAGFEVSNDGTTFGDLTTAPGTGVTTIFVRLKATDNVANSPYSGDITVSGSGVTDQTVHIDASTVTQAALTLSVEANDRHKMYGTLLAGEGPGSTEFTATGLQNSDQITSVTVTFGSGAAASFAAGTYTDAITPSNPVGASFDPNNYNITYVNGDIIVDPAPLTITANDATKAYGLVLAGGAGSTEFTSSPLQNSETIGTVTIAYGAHNVVDALVGTYPNEVTASDATGGTFDPANYDITYEQGSLIVVSGTFTKLQILLPGETADPTNPAGKTGSPTSHTQTSPFNVTVNAVDDGWNIVNTATDMVHLTSTAPFPNLPADAALFNGTVSMPVTLNTVGTWTITASDATNNLITANESAPVQITAITACPPATLFSQDFSSGTNLATYTGTGTNQIDNFTTGSVNSSISIVGGALQFDKESSSNNMSFTKSTDLASPAPTALMYKFSFTPSTLANNLQAGWQVGSGFSTATNGAQATYFAQFTISELSATNYQINGSGNFSGTQNVTWVMNKTGGTLSYTGADGNPQTLANNTQDLWIGTTLLLNDGAASTSSQSLTDLKFWMTTAHGFVTMDDFQITDPTQGGPTVTKPSDQIVCPNIPTPQIDFSGSGGATGFLWTNNHPEIGLAASGAGSVPSFSPINATTSPIVATISVTPSNGSCTGASQTFTITVNPTPVADFHYSASSYCKALTASTQTPAFDNNGVAGTFSSLPAGLVINSSTGVIDLQASASGTYTVTNTIAATGTCPETPFSTTVEIRALPQATITYTLNQTTSIFCTSDNSTKQVILNKISTPIQVLTQPRHLA